MSMGQKATPAMVCRVCAMKDEWVNEGGKGCTGWQVTWAVLGGA
jgi:hypothetical protein